MRKTFLVLAILLLPLRLYALTDEGFESLDVFSKVLRYVEQEYVEKVDDRELIRGAIRGMLQSLDPHTVYMSPETYKDLKASTSGTFGGVGVEITVKDGWLTVVTPIEGTPADKAGLEPGDRIARIDGASTRDMDLSDAVAKMRGSRGSDIHLSILREGHKKTFDVVLTRQIIRVPSVKFEVLDNHYGYVRISSFSERSGSDLQKVLKQLEKKDALHGLILDLRNNPGGLLDQAVQVSDLFLKSGVIVTTESRSKEVDRKEAVDNGTEKDFPMIVLVNGGAASASEIVAGALQDHKRAVILGTRSFGKGSVQTVVELDDGSALKLTVARYYTPSGRSIQAEGIVPDIIVENISPKSPEEQPTKHQIREEDLQGHLEGESAVTTEVTKAKPAVKEDYQKTVALGYLKSWDLFKSDW